MSGNLRGRRRFLGTLGAAVLASLYGGSVVSAAPEPMRLHDHPDVNWFAAWDENLAPTSTNFFPTPSPLNFSIPTIQATYNATPTNARMPAIGSLARFVHSLSSTAGMWSTGRGPRPT